MSESTPRRRQLAAILQMMKFRPLAFVAVVALNIVTAILEGISAAFIVPIIQSSTVSGESQSSFATVLENVYTALGVPFVLETILLGVSLLIVVRYTLSFLSGYYTRKIRTYYVRDLQSRAFDAVLDTKVGYFDRRGSDEILNTIITESKQSGQVIERIMQLFQILMITAAYTVLIVILAPKLSLIAVVFLGSMGLLVRFLFNQGYSLGERVAKANEAIQTSVQTGTQGIRDVKLFGMESEIYKSFSEAVDQYAVSDVRYARNRVAMEQLYSMLTALSMFILLYLAFRFTALNIAELGTFLFAIFRLSPRVSSINGLYYDLEANLPHLVRIQDNLEAFEAHREPDQGTDPVPETVERIEFDNVEFAYQEEPVLQDISFDVQRGEFIAFVGPSGAGKSTIVSLLSRLYEPAHGDIRANGHPIDRFQVDEWRSKLAVVRQQPFVFNESLRENVTIGNRNATNEEIERACEVARVTEFLEDLPAGYDSDLGDDGVRLSGGQRQRIAIARALLTDRDVLVLDEATSDLDTSLEDAVHQGIESTSEDRTLIVIAHRLSTIENADRIYTMQNGRIVEVGSHAELLGAEGLYAELYAAQETD